VVGDNKRRSFHLLVGATLTIGTAIVGSVLTSSLTTGDKSWVDGKLLDAHHKILCIHRGFITACLDNLRGFARLGARYGARKN
jgi:hypothetical protein